MTALFTILTFTIAIYIALSIRAIKSWRQAKTRLGELHIKDHALDQERQEIKVQRAEFEQLAANLSGIRREAELYRAQTAQANGTTVSKLKR